MLILTSWLREFVRFDAPVDKLAYDLTMAGLEIEGVEPAYKDLDKVVVGKIVESKPINEELRKLKICKVDIGSEVVQVVCGAPNAKEGIFAPVVLDGAQLLGGEKIEKTKIHGVVSEAMLASEKELYLGDDSWGLMELDPEKEPKPGQSLKDFLGLEDWILEVSITPNRPDCLSVLGVAREISAIYKLPLKDDLYLALMGIVMPRGKKNPKEQSNSISAKDAQNLQEIPVEIEIEDKEHCFRYCGLVLKDIKVEDSPSLIKRRLYSCGMRPINNVVDITNYVLLERGQPLHAFDLDKLSGPKIIVRSARQGESIVTLDGKERKLEPGMLVIADAEKPVAIAGVMGGLESEVTKDTKRILLESACFEPIQVRITRKKLKLNTEASYRFERAVDPEGVLPGIQRAMGLMVQYCLARPCGPPIDIYTNRFKPIAITVEPKKVNKVLGTDLTREQMVRLLLSIRMGMEEEQIDLKGDEQIVCYPPPYRSDLKEDIDLIEEIARLYGYDNIETTLPVAELVPAIESSSERLISKVRHILNAYGLTEIISYSFCSPKDIRALGFKKDDPRLKWVALKNPLTEEHSVLRTELISCLLNTASRNISYRNLDIKIFEIGKTFINRGRERLPEEELRLCGLMTGKRYPVSWALPQSSVDLFDLKAVVETLLDEVCGANSWNIKLNAKTEPYYLPGTSIEFFDPNAKLIGSLGQVDPKVLRHFDIEKASVFVFDLSLPVLENWIDRKIVFRQIPRFPAVERDIAVIVDKHVPALDLVDFVKSKDIELLEEICIFDVYTGKPIPKDKKSIGLRFRYRAKDHTLTEEEINSVHKPLVDSILKQFKAELRA